MSASFLGIGSFVGLVEESTWGTAVSPRTKFFRLLPGANVTRDVQRSGRNPMSYPGSIPMQQAFVDERDNAGGSFAVLAGYQSLGIFLKHLLGTAGTPAGGPTTYATEYTLTAALPTGLTMHFGSPQGSGETFEGCLINRGTLAVEAGGQTRFSVDEFIAETSGGRTSPDTTTFGSADQIIDHHHFGGLSWDGDSYATLKSFSLSVNNGLQRRPVVGSKYTARPTRSGLIAVEAQVQVEIDDQFYTDWLAGVQDDAGAIVATYDANTSMTVELQNFYLSRVSAPIQGPGLLTSTLTFVAQGDGTDHGLKVTLENASASALGTGGVY
jgi:hypothetical protein